MRIGEEVEVHVRYTDTWATGFQVADVVEGGCRLRRRSDGALLPVVTSDDDLRPCAAPSS